MAAKHGGEQLRLSLTQAERFGHKPEVDLVALDDALKDLAATNPQHSRVIELRFFGGLTIEETAQVMSLSHATTERYWSFARAWLRRELAPEEYENARKYAATRGTLSRSSRARGRRNVPTFMARVRDSNPRTGSLRSSP